MKKKPVVSSFNRREFMAATSAAAFSHAAVRAEASKHSPDLADHIHPDVWIDRGDLARDENAFWIWKDAVSNLTPLDEFADEYFENAEGGVDRFTDEFEFWDAVRKAQDPLAPFPRGEAEKCVRAWLASCQEPLELIQRGIAKHRYQVPQKHLLDVTIDDVGIPRAVARLKTVLCNVYLHDDEQALATETVSELLEMSRMALNGDGTLVHYSFGTIHWIVMECVNAFVFHPRTSHQALGDLHRLLAKTRPTADSLARVFRVDVVYPMQHEVTRLAQTVDLKELVDVLVKRHLMLNSDDPDFAFLDDNQIRRVRRGMLELFAGHPQPLDPAETMRLYSGVVAQMISDLSSPWLKRKKGLADQWLKQIEPWPQPLWFLNGIGLSLHGKDKEDRDVSDAEIGRARATLFRVHNPIGKLMLHYLDSFEMARQSFHARQLETDVGLLLIACRLFRDEQKRLPRELSELVDTHHLDAVPLDPFSGNPVRYDSNRKLVWSFGIDEEDNGGDWDFEADIPLGNDLVWRVAL